MDEVRSGKIYHRGPLAGSEADDSESSAMDSAPPSRADVASHRHYRRVTPVRRYVAVSHAVEEAMGL